MTDQVEQSYHASLSSLWSADLKFWEIRVQGCEVSTRQGALKKQHAYKWRSKAFDTPEKALASAQTKRRNQMKKGFVEADLDEQGNVTIKWPESFDAFFGEFRSLLTGERRCPVSKLKHLYEAVYARYPERTEGELDDYLHEQMAKVIPSSLLSKSVRIFEYPSHKKSDWREAIVMISPEERKRYPFARFMRELRFYFNGNGLFHDVEQFDELPPSYMFERPINASLWSKSDIFARLELLYIHFKNLSDPWQYEDSTLHDTAFEMLIHAAKRLKHLWLSTDALHWDAWKVFKKENILSLESLTLQSDFFHVFSGETFARQNIHTFGLSSYSSTMLSDVLAWLSRQRTFLGGISQLDIDNHQEKSLSMQLGERFGQVESLDGLDTLSIKYISEAFLVGWCKPEARSQIKTLIVHFTKPSMQIIERMASLEHWPFERVIFPTRRSDFQEFYAGQIEFIKQSGVAVEIRA